MDLSEITICAALFYCYWKAWRLAVKWVEERDKKRAGGYRPK